MQSGIDAYDILDVKIDASQEDIKKAFKIRSLKEHPDKNPNRDPDEANRRFIEIKTAHQILENEDRRKRYDTFGFDFGAEPPETEVWNIGLTAILQPFGSFMLRTIVCRFGLWLITFRWIAYILLMCGIISIVLYALNINLPFSAEDPSTGQSQPMSIRSQEAASLIICVVIVNVIIVIGWVWPLLVDAVGVLWLGYEYMPIQPDDLKVMALALLGSLFVAWLVRGWWWWIIGGEVCLAIVLLIGIMIAAGLIRLWMDQIQATKGQEIKSWRESMRRDREKMRKEIERAKSR